MTFVNAHPARSTIGDRQNQEWSITLLAAQRQLYSELKYWRSLRVWIAIGAAVVGLLATLFAPSLLILVSPLAAVAAVGQWIGNVVERQQAKTAATIQEQFDTTVLCLTWNPTLGQPVDNEDVIAASNRFNGARSELANWYSVPHDVPYPLDVLLCQRSNLRWDAALRQSYARLLLAGLIFLLLILLVIGALKHLNVGELALSLLPSLGLFIFVGETIRVHHRHAADQTTLKQRVEALWGKGCAKPRSVKSSDLRSIQDQIFTLRTAAPPVPDAYYRRKRQEMEEQMKLATARLWEQARARNG